MGEQMLSWHKVGQKVAVVDGDLQWETVSATPLERIKDWLGWYGPEPVPDTVYLVENVHIGRGGLVMLELAGFAHSYAADDFRPVYPTIIDSLRSLDAPINHHEVEHV